MNIFRPVFFGPRRARNPLGLRIDQCRARKCGRHEADAQEGFTFEVFSTEGCEFKVDREGAELADFKKDLQAMMATGISTDLTKRLVFAVPAGKHLPSPEKAWLIRGSFVRVYQGSRLLRGAIGFGLGGTKLETHVEVYDLADGSDKPFLTFFHHRRQQRGTRSPCRRLRPIR